MASYWVHRHVRAVSVEAHFKPQKTAAGDLAGDTAS